MDTSPLEFTPYFPTVMKTVITNITLCVALQILTSDCSTGQDQKAAKASPQKTSVSAKKNEDEKSEKNSALFDATQSNGILNDIKEPLSKILKFKRKSGRLAFDIPTSYSEADGAFREIRTKARGGGGGHGSGNFWTQYVSGQSFGGRIQKSDQNFGRGAEVRPNSLVVEFLETADNAAGIEVQADDLDEFTIRINGGLAPYYLQVCQSKSKFSVQEVNGHTSYAGSGSDFESFCKNNPDFVQQSLIPALANYGFASPVTRFNATTRDHVFAILSPADDEALKSFQEAFKNLESTKYEERQAASKKLNSEFEKWKDVIRYAVGSDQFSLEVRSRLQKLIKDKSSEADRQLVALVAAGDLSNDAEYLVWLLGQAKEAKQTQNVIDKLKKLTEQDFGNDIAAWKKHVEEVPADTATTIGNKVNTVQNSKSGPPAIAKLEGYLPQMAEPTSDLLRLKLEASKLSLDRKYWSDQFNGESIKTLVTRLQDQVKKSNLPKRWLNSGGHSLDTVRHEHVLFEHIQTVLPSQMSSHHYSYGNISGYHTSSINRKIEKPHIYLRLNLEKLKREAKSGRILGAKNKPNIFQYTVRERRDFNMELSFVEREDSSVNFMVASSDNQSLFQLHQSKNGKVSCHLLVEGQKSSVTAENFMDLYENHKEFITQSVYPVFARFGVQIPKEIGGPLEIKNAPRPKKKS